MNDPIPEHVTDHQVEATYRAAMELAQRARAYISDRAGDTLGTPPGEAEAVYAAETMRISTRIMHVVAWAMNRKAVAAGEIDEAEARGPDRRLGGEAICRAAPVGDLRALPEPVQEMVAASRDLYDRAARLEHLLDTAHETGGAGDEPAVHKLWREIEDFED